MSEPEMKISPERAAALVSQLQAVQNRIAAAAKGRPVRLVAVSKLKPANDILALHNDPATRHLHFGENYAQELGQKAAMLPSSIRWHFIGGLQSGHCKNLGKIPNLWCVSSVDTLKKAQLLDKSRGELLASFTSTSSTSPTTAPSSSGPSSPAPGPLNVHVQVNTSGEDSKSGCAPGADTVTLCRAIAQDCPNLRLLGLMTIGAIARSRAAAAEGEENEDFVALSAQRDLVARELGMEDSPSSSSSAEGHHNHHLELSMGMSDDFEGAITLGSDEVRVGSTIFGERPAKADANIVAS